MVALTGWSTPSSDATFTYTGPASIQYLNGYFIAAHATSGSLVNELKYATDAKGTWSLATMPARPSGMASIPDTSPNRVFWDGTHYATAVRYVDAGLANDKSRILYATTPGGTWTSYEFDSSDTYRAYDFGYYNGQWVIVGTDVSVNPGRAFIATSSTANGTYTFYTATSETGLDPTTISSGTKWVIRSIRYSGGAYVTEYINLGGTASGLKTSTSLTSSWATPSSAPANPTYAYLTFNQSVRGNTNGYWFSYVDPSAAGLNDVIYTSSPSGTWSTVTGSTLGLSSATDAVTGMSHDGTNYVYVGGNEGGSTNLARYSPGTGAPTGSWTSVTTGLASSNVVWDIVYVDPIHVVVQHDGSIRYSNDIPFLRPGPTYLRLHQSPVWAPSRVRGVDIRQRQTPIITK